MNVFNVQNSPDKLSKEFMLIEILESRILSSWSPVHVPRFGERMFFLFFLLQDRRFSGLANYPGKIVHLAPPE